MFRAKEDGFDTLMKVLFPQKQQPKAPPSLWDDDPWYAPRRLMEDNSFLSASAAKAPKGKTAPGGIASGAASALKSPATKGALAGGLKSFGDLSRKTPLPADDPMTYNASLWKMIDGVYDAKPKTTQAVSKSPLKTASGGKISGAVVPAKKTTPPKATTSSQGSDINWENFRSQLWLAPPLVPGLTLKPSLSTPLGNKPQVDVNERVYSPLLKNITSRGIGDEPPHGPLSDATRCMMISDGMRMPIADFVADYSPSRTLFFRKSAGSKGSLMKNKTTDMKSGDTNMDWFFSLSNQALNESPRGEMPSQLYPDLKKLSIQVGKGKEFKPNEWNAAKEADRFLGGVKFKDLFDPQVIEDCKNNYPNLFPVVNGGGGW